jgi:uncharacterized protein YqkB
MNRRSDAAVKILFNEETAEKLQKSLGDRPGYFKLFYDVEDCGCNGVLVIRIVKEPYHTDLPIEAGPFAFFADAKQESLFDAEMRLEADPAYPSFKLVSDSSIISSNIKIVDVREI